MKATDSNNIILKERKKQIYVSIYIYIYRYTFIYENICIDLPKNILYDSPNIPIRGGPRNPQW